MKRKNPIFSLLLVLVMLPLAGCGNPLQQALAAREGLNLTLAGLNTAHRQGQLSIEDKVALDPFVQQADKAVKEMTAAALSGSWTGILSDFDTASQNFERAIFHLATALAEAEKRKAVPLPATRPQASPATVDDSPAPPPVR